MHPGELKHHECLTYTLDTRNATWLFQIGDCLESTPVRSRLSANNGEALMEAAVAGMGIAVQPDFIIEPYRAAGSVEVLLESFAPPALGIYALLPSHRHMPHRVRVLIDFLAAQLRGGGSPQ